MQVSLMDNNTKIEHLNSGIYKLKISIGKQKKSLYLPSVDRTSLFFLLLARSEMSAIVGLSVMEGGFGGSHGRSLVNACGWERGTNYTFHNNNDNSLKIPTDKANVQNSIKLGDSPYK